MASTFTTNKSIEKPGNGDYVNDWNVPVNADWDIIDKAFGGVQILNPTSVSGSVTLTTTQYQAPILIVGASISSPATLTANVTYVTPSGIGGVWTVYNHTTGSFTITFASAGGGSSVILAQGYVTTIYSDGTNIVQASSSFTPSTVPSGTNMLFYQAAAPTGWTQLTSVNDYALRVVSGTGAVTNGSIGMSTMFSGSYQDGATTLTTAQIPSHSHGVNDPGHVHGGMNAAAFPDTFNSTPYVPNNAGFDTPYNWSAVTGISIQSTGGGGSHTHTIPNLQYADVIICTKN
jgi:microcystin-dependent protein